jgi:Domain of unknown function (DUF5916)/Carbohydrate family 9 binding domain-like
MKTTSSSFSLVALIATLQCVTVTVPAVAQNSPPEDLQGRYTSTPPKIDGILDDEVWAGEPLQLGPWVSYNPMRGQPATENTSVWIAYDERAIYFAFHCYDSEPGKIRTTISRRDNAWNDDWIAISLDSSHVGQVAYHMFVNPSGIQMDGLNTGSNGEDMAPDWVWQSAGRVVADGYTVEVRLPLESIRFKSGPHVQMGVLFFRRIARSGVSWSWPEIAPGKWVFETHVPLGFDNLQQPRLLDVIPSATLSNNRSRTPASSWNPARTKGDIGATLKYGVTSTVTVEATANPDFSQVESDAYQVEVNNRYPVFFSEKRPFFMEGLGLFNLAGTGGDSSMRTAVHTRRIIDPSAGVKLTGTAGRQSFAILSSADASPAGNAQRTFTVGRDVVNFGQGQYAGILTTDTEYRGEHNRVIGGDLALRRGDRFSWNGSLLYSASGSLDGERKQGTASQLSYSYNTHRLNFAGQLENYGRGFQMDTAFYNRVGFSRIWTYEEVQFYPDAHRFGWIKRIAPFFWLLEGNDRVQGGSEQYTLPGIRFNFTRAGFVRLDLGRGHEMFANRRFQTGQQHVEANVQLTRWLNLSGSSMSGPAIFYDPQNPLQGNAVTSKFSVELQPNARLNNNISYNFTTFDRRDTRENVYHVHIVNLRNTYQFTPRFLVRAITQFDSSQRRVLGDFLASYELSPGTVAHAGYGTLLERQATQTYMTTARAFFFKVSYLAHL